MANAIFQSAQQRDLLQQWLSETGELYVDIYHPHSGYGGTAYFVRSLEELEELIARQTWRVLEVTVFRRMQYSSRGIADESLLEQALQLLPDNEREWYTIVLLEDLYYPKEPRWVGSGATHAEFRKEFSALRGRQVAIGQNPFDKDTRRTRSTPNEAMVLHLRRSGDYYEPNRS